LCERIYSAINFSSSHHRGCLSQTLAQNLCKSLLFFWKEKSMISFDAVSKFILNDVSIHIPQGVAVGLIGPSGAGKTTFLKLACGLLMPEKGEVYTLGVSQPSSPSKKKLAKKIGVLFADKSLFDQEESVISNFRSLQIAYGLSEEQFTREYTKLAKRLGFGEYENNRVKTLSLGQRRRAELGAVLLHNPRLLLLDEPMIGLDATVKEVIRGLIEERLQEGMSLVITSHNMTDIFRLCNRIAILHQGKIIYYGGRERLLRNFAPMDMMYLKLCSKLPDMSDLPLKKYEINCDELTITYNSNHITSVEILKLLTEETSILDVSIHKPNLQDVIFEIEKSLGESRNE